jgi:hypothetical protein
MFIIPNLQFLFFINQTNSWYRDLSRKFPISFHRRRNWLLCRRFAPRSRKRKIKKLSIPQKVCCVFPLTVCKQVKPPLLPRLCFIFLWTTRRASEVRFALMGQSLDFSSSFFLSLVSPVLCVYCVHTAEARLINAELRVHERTANRRLMNWLDRFYFRKPMGEERPAETRGLFGGPQQRPSVSARSLFKPLMNWSCCCCSPVSVYIVYSLSNVAQTQLLFPRSEPGCGCPAASRPSVYFASLYRSHFISRNNRATGCFRTSDRTHTHIYIYTVRPYFGVFDVYIGRRFPHRSTTDRR